jgi:hypothetical protein
MNDFPVSRKNKLAVLIVGIVLGVIAAAILIPPLVVRFSRLSGQGSNQNPEPQGESPNTVPYTYRGKHAHRDGEAIATSNDARIAKALWP